MENISLTWRRRSLILNWARLMNLISRIAEQHPFEINLNGDRYDLNVIDALVSDDKKRYVYVNGARGTFEFL